MSHGPPDGPPNEPDEPASGLRERSPEEPEPAADAAEHLADDSPGTPAHNEHPLASYVLRVNGAERPVTDAWLGESLLYVLRERLGLAGAKDGCEQGECGACSVQVDGRLVAVLPGARRDRRRQRGAHRRGPRRRRPALRRPARARQVRRRAVRLLRPGHGDDRARPPGGQPGADRTGDAPGPVRQPVPLLRLPGRPERRPRGRLRARGPRVRGQRRGRRTPDLRCPYPAPGGPGRRKCQPVRVRVTTPHQARTARTEARREQRHRHRDHRGARHRPGAAPHGLGVSLPSAEALAKTEGTFPYAADLWAEGLLWAAVLRSPHPHARIRPSTPPTRARCPAYGPSSPTRTCPATALHGRGRADRPVFASEVVRHHGEPIAAVAADHPDTARLAAAAVIVEYETLDPVTDPEQAFEAEPLHPDGNLIRHIPLRFGDPDAVGEIVVEGLYRIGRQDPAPIGAEAGLAVPRPDGGVELYVASTDPHADRDTAAACFGLEPDRVKVVVTGVPGATADREDQSFQLAARTARPEDRMSGQTHRDARRVLPRARPPAPDAPALPAPRRRRRQAGQGRGADPARRGRVRRHVVRGPRRRRLLRLRPVRRPARLHRGLGRPHQQPALRARTRRGRHAGVRRLRGPDGQAAEEARRRPGRTAPAERDGHRGRASHRPDRDVPGPGRRTAAGRARLRRCPPLPTDTPEDEWLLPGGPEGAGEPGAVRRGVGYALGMVHMLGAEGADEVSTATVKVHDGIATVHLRGRRDRPGLHHAGPADRPGDARHRRGARRLRGHRPAPRRGPAAEAATPGCPAARSNGPPRWSVRSCSSRWPHKFGMSIELLQITDGKITSYDGVLSHDRRGGDGRQGAVGDRAVPPAPHRAARRAPARATPSSASPSARSARSSTSTSNWARYASSRWPSPRTSAGC